MSGHMIYTRKGIEYSVSRDYTMLAKRHGYRPWGYMPDSLLPFVSAEDIEPMDRVKERAQAAQEKETKQRGIRKRKRPSSE